MAKFHAFFIATLLMFLSFLGHATPTLDEKIGQMLIIGFDGQEVTENSPITQVINHYNIGGVILFDFNKKTGTFDKNISSPKQLKKLNQSLKEQAERSNRTHHRDDLPLLISVDYEGGVVTRLRKDKGFPDTYSAKRIAQMPLSEAQDAAKEMANTLHTYGFNLDFAPVLDVDINPNNPVIGGLERSFSENPYVVQQYAQLFATEFTQHQIECAYKHFPGHGSSDSDSHLGFVDVTESWQEKELLPFELSINEPNHCHMIMSAHIVNRKLDPSGLPATLSKSVLTGLLRNKLHFDGVIITDDMQMKAITEHYGLEQALSLAINAGADMLIFGNQLSDTAQNPGEIIQIIRNKVKTGEIPEARINDAYAHIVEFKKRLKPQNKQ
ncbi:glycoside hydrolase family 3 protein [Legionella yabuuchiae]|uniref:glycoside hydrolase family 3 protein n=1 Tax=Legionella yabuuchiae TaxID=376727 RepID=UPI0010565DF4|nr:glycoside hydrolase family 3 N-terminal domain-containing protein [Legionella yabuuchiae]